MGPWGPAAGPGGATVCTQPPTLHRGCVPALAPLPHSPTPGPHGQGGRAGSSARPRALRLGLSGLQERSPRPVHAVGTALCAAGFSFRPSLPHSSPASSSPWPRCPSPGSAYPLSPRRGHSLLTGGHRARTEIIKCSERAVASCAAVRRRRLGAGSGSGRSAARGRQGRASSGGAGG